MIRTLVSAVLLATLLALPHRSAAQDETARPAGIQDPGPSESGPRQPDDPGFEWLRAEGHDDVVCPFRASVDYEPGDLRCGLIQVPENREVPGSRTIELLFVHIRATGEDEDGEAVEVRDDPVIYLTGGPGVGVAGYVDRLKDHSIVQGRDLYILEQRGIENSGDFCPFYDGRDRAKMIHDEWSEAQQALIEQARACAARARGLGVDLTGYHTFENARDVRALRMALGFENWNVWGISYGSVLGQALLQVDPEGIRAMVIDAIVPLNLDELMRIPHWSNRMLDRFFAACLEQRACRRNYPDLEDRYFAAIESMIEQPAEADVPAGEMFPDGKAWIFQDVVAGLPFGMAYEQSRHPAIPAMMDGLARAVSERDPEFFEALAIAMTEPDPGFSISMGMSMAVRCQDGYFAALAEEAPADFERYPVLARAFGDLAMIERAPEVCRELGMPARDPAQYRLVDSPLPVVVANGAWDPITPPPLARIVADSLTNSRYVEFPHAGHGPTRSLDCAGGFLNGFFDDPAAELDMECVREGEEAAEYLAPLLETAAMRRGIVMEATDEQRLKIHVAWLGASLVPMAVGFLAIGLAWLSRRFGAPPAGSAGGARLAAFLAGTAGLGWAVGLGMGLASSVEVTPALLLFGIAGPAPFAAWLAPVAGVLGLVALLIVLRARRDVAPLPWLGLLFVAASAVSLSAFAWVWDLWPM
ncbi:MAG: alpha/beta fold hydrolase [Wenzhouxiangellaceae bacterium]|nr:alpha/beta fold hydrolase [Wenzhouxiangellaceae bacterium]